MANQSGVVSCKPARHLSALSAIVVALSLSAAPAASDEAAGGSAAPTSASLDIIKPLKSDRLTVSFAYQFELLDAALKRSVAKYGPYVEEPYTDPMSPARDQIEGPRGRLINVLVANAGVKALDEGMLHVPFPLDKGLLGTRVAFIRADGQEEIGKVRSIADLRRFTFGQGTGWGDVKVLEHNGLVVHTATEYESLAEMLLHRRYDLFPRGVNEIMNEFKAYGGRFPGLAIEQHLVIKYPFPQYFYVSKSAPRIAERIMFGLQEMLKDGSFEMLFNKHFGKVLAALKLEQRIVINLQNPFLPDWASTRP